MKFENLEVRNFRAVTYLEMHDLPDVVVLAGPNGCGKSSIFDAIRMLKSFYGGYQPNEWQQWMSEFQINLNRRQDELLGLFQDRDREMVVQVEISLSDEEKAWLENNITDVSWEMAWRQAVPDAEEGFFRARRPLAANLRAHEEQVESKAKREAPEILRELEQGVYHGKVVIRPDGRVELLQSRVLEVAFSIYHPNVIGILDYHGPQRSYAREAIGGINLSIESNEDRLRQHALYNYQNKYSNIKTELAAAYIRELLASRAGVTLGNTEDLVTTLRELFTVFFPGKEFLGPEPTRQGGLLFNVRTAGNKVHDINELSSGEKEVLYGYLRLRNAAPRNSVLLIDEPELHLNPRLTDGLPEFYHRHLGRALNNQIWLATHSDAILRQAVGRPLFKVFHMQQPDVLEEGANQLREVTIAEEIDRAVIALVGDLAAYRPGAKLVIVEGGGESEFDMSVIRDLFPDLQKKVNLISGGNRSSVQHLHAVLESARAEGVLPARVYSIVDRDFDDASEMRQGAILQWDRFHIENYLVDEVYIRRVLIALDVPGAKHKTDVAVRDELVCCARHTIPYLIRFFLEREANSKLIGCIRTRVDPASADLPAALVDAVRSSISRASQAAEEDLSADRLQSLAREHNQRLEAHLGSEEWRRTFRGRDILKRYTSMFMGGVVGYLPFRNLIVSQMREDGFKPPGMVEVIQEVLAD